MAKKKFNLEKLEHERIPKKTSIGRRPKMSSMNKHKRRSLRLTIRKENDISNLEVMLWKRLLKQ